MAVAASVSILAGWTGICLGFVSGAWLGLATSDDAAFGGYASLNRRYLRLGHIALAALGMVNVQAGLTTQAGFPMPDLARALLLAGLALMPLACFLHAAGVKRRTALFALPAGTLILGGGLVAWNLW